MKKLFFVIFCMAWFSISFAQPDRWQQRVKYVMDIDMNIQTNRLTGKQKLEYWNNSPDTLKRVFYHLYWNAFQPNSMMDTRSRRQGTLQTGGSPDWDRPIQDKIQNLGPAEIGYHKITSVKMNGRVQSFNVMETILEVKLDKPILPRSKSVFDMVFESQVPLIVRRGGRDHPATTVRYSMSQWYPKLCEYDYQGWHADPYVAREFYGVWGDFEVNISIDKSYILGGTGYLRNANQVGHGYEEAESKLVRTAGNKLTWKFIAPNVHDFVWAADPDYIHKSLKLSDSLTLHLLYKPTNAPAADWEKILESAQRALPFIEKSFGRYPYRNYSFIHGGDSGMEYPMATLLIRPSSWLHELIHSWYQGVLATNESLYSWMDEGFTDFATSRVKAFLASDSSWPHAGSYSSYFNLVKSNKEEPLTTHADHFNTNFAYWIASYGKGAVFMEQLGYITGAEVRDRILLQYYRQWKFKHPGADDFFRVAEKTSNMELDWYKDYWVNTTRTIDYAFDSLWEENGKTRIRIKRIGLMPMPVDLSLSFKDGTTELHYIPLGLMYGMKPEEHSTPRKVYPPWQWTHENYVIETSRRLSEISIAEIDPSQRMADVERKNNRLKL